jgi:hypothetical protein
MHLQVGSQCTSNGRVAVTALSDNSFVDNGAPGVKYEVAVSIVACKDLAVGARPSFQVSVGAVAS